jgi:hypothetical protein
MKEKWMVSMKGSWIGDATTPHPPPPRNIPDVPDPPPKRIIKEDVSKEFFKGMVWALLIIILLHVGLAYVLLY